MRALALIVLVLCLPSCGPGSRDPLDFIDLQAERAALLRADQEWLDAYSSADDGAAAFVERLADDARLLPPGTAMADDRDTIHAFVRDLGALPGFSMRWSPQVAEVSAAGDLGYTLGSYEMRLGGPGGMSRVDGKYVTVWRKQDGAWMVVADIFNANGPPAAVAAEPEQ